MSRSATQAAPTNIVSPPTSFVGRRDELAAVQRLLFESRLLTLTGAGGCGKSRLALQVATNLIGEPDFVDGIWWIALADLIDPALVPQAAGQVLDVPETPGRPLTETLVEHLTSLQTLIILDNCEHLAAACAELAEALLSAAPGLRVLATSRQPLGSTGEVSWLVPSLSVPQADDDQSLGGIESLLEYDAVQLFVARARAFNPSFDFNASNAPAVMQICTRLDGIPLAIELAAGRAGVLALPQIAERLDNAFLLLTGGNRTALLPRHQTLRAALEWSIRLLTEAELALFRRLGVFSGGFTLEAAETVAGDENERRKLRDEAGGAGDLPPSSTGLHPAEILDLLASLVDKSLLMAQTAGRRQARYRRLDTIRQYAVELLEASGESAHYRRRHLAWCLDLAQQSETGLLGEEQDAWLARLDEENDNLRAALAWAQKGSDDVAQVEAGLRLAGALWRFWHTRGSFTEGRRWLEAQLAKTDAAHDSDAPTPAGIDAAVYAKALFSAAALHYRQGNYPSAMTLAERSLSVRRNLGDIADQAAVLNLLGVMDLDQDDYDQAEVTLEEALGLRRQMGDPWGIATGLLNLGRTKYYLSEFRSGLQLYEEAVALYRRLGDRRSLALVLGNMGEIGVALGEYARAAQVLQESLALQRELDDKWASAIAMNNLADVARIQGEPAKSAALAEKSLTLCRELGDQTGIATALVIQGDLARDASDLTTAGAKYDEALAIFKHIGQRHGAGLASHGLGLTARQAGDLARARRYHFEGLTAYFSARFPPGVADSLEGLAALSAAEAERASGESRRERLERTARLLGSAAALRAALEAPAHPPERVWIDRAAETARAGLADEFAAAFGWGQAQELAEAVAFALAGAEMAEAAEPQGAPGLRIQSFGEVRVQNDTRWLAPADWKYLKARELLFYLLSRPSATKEQIGLALWPEASPGQLRSSLHRVIHHLRRALGQPGWIRFEEDRYSFNRGQGYWWDAEAFEGHLAAAGALLRIGVEGSGGKSSSGQHSGDMRTQAIFHLEQAARLYQGEWLAEVEVGEWAVGPREQYRAEALEAMVSLGEALLAEGRPAEAAQAFRRAISHDSYLEAAHRGLIQALAAQGDMGRARRAYDDLARLLADELGALPSAETTELHERLREGKLD